MSILGTRLSHRGGGCYFALSFILSLMGGCSLGIIVFIVNLIGGGDILGAVSSATLCGLCTVLVGMGLSLIIYAVAKSIVPRKKVDEWRMPVYKESEYVEYEEIIEED